jgi:glutathione synthase/RimK-type ligase-like ATP-grasp enzyme
MILLYGISEDSPMSLLRDELDKAGANYCFLDHRDIFNFTIEYKYSKKKPAEIIINSPEMTIDFSDVTAVYNRPYNFMDYAEMNGKAPDDPIAVAAMGFENQFMSCLEASDAFIVNRSEPSASNNSKPYQLSVIKDTGLKIPLTFITNEPIEAKQFIQKNTDCIYKSISGVRSIVKRVSENHYEYMDDVKWCPTLFQKFVSGINYRAHVINNDIFTVRIESDTLDYRYGNTRMMIEELPPDIAQKCIRLTSVLGLHFSGIDLMRTPDDEWYCFEVNPSPAYSYFQLSGGLQISNALARVLINPVTNHQT